MLRSTLKVYIGLIMVIFFSDTPCICIDIVKRWNFLCLFYFLVWFALFYSFCLIFLLVSMLFASFLFCFTLPFTVALAYAAPYLFAYAHVDLTAELFSLRLYSLFLVQRLVQHQTLFWLIYRWLCFVFFYEWPVKLVSWAWIGEGIELK